MGQRRRAAAGAQELTGRVPQLEAPHSQSSSPHGRRSRRGSGGERGGGVGSPPHAGPISRRVVRGGRPRPTARGAGRDVADAAERARPPEHRPDSAADWAWRPPQAAVLVERTRPTAPAAVTTTWLAMPEPVVEKAPLPPKSEYCLVKLCSNRITLLLICFSDRNHKLIEQLLNCHQKMNLLHSVD